jgi:hypothetical protein
MMLSSVAGRLVPVFAGLLLALAPAFAQERVAPEAFVAGRLADPPARADLTTLRYFDPEDVQHLWGPVTGVGGWVHGTNGFFDRAKAVGFRLPQNVASARVHEVNVYFAFRHPEATMQTYRIDVMTGETGLGPQQIIHSQSFAMADVQADGDPTTPSPVTPHVMSQPVDVPQTFFVAVYLPQPYGVEDLAIAATDSLDAFSPYEWEQWSDGSWHPFSGGPGTWQRSWHLWVEAVVELGPVSNEAGAGIPAVARLEQAFPNPFRASTDLGFTLPAATHAVLTVHDALGREVARLIDRPLPAGTHHARFDGAGLPAGVYLARLTAGAHADTRRILLVR